ncbi:hypothetical protein [Deinococcus koreensis]|uniref:hypothetical protein n=1 Tax=Deinococcus koreensis TaxID=2054903 RepID=UPI001056F48F|nr:hypothetical protein [Deinococcus koreensis]
MSNIILPNVIGQAEFSKWRQILTMLAFAGLAHIGLADGLQIIWLKTKGMIGLGSAISLGFVMAITAPLLICFSYFILGGLHYTTIGLFVLTSLNAFFINYLLSHGSARILTFYYFLQSLVYIVFIILEGYFHLVGRSNAAVIGQVLLILTTLLYAFIVFYYDKRKLNYNPSIRDILIQSDGLAYFTTNVVLILLFSFDRILAIRVLDESQRSQYFFCSLFITVSSTLLLYISNVIFSRGVILNYKMRLACFFIGVLLCLSTAVLSEDWIATSLNSVFPDFSINNVKPFIYCSILVAYFLISPFTIMKRFYVRLLILLTIANISVFSLIILQFAVNQYRLIALYTLCIASITLMCELLIVFMQMIDKREGRYAD